MGPISNHFKIGDIVQTTSNDDVYSPLRGRLFKIIDSPHICIAGRFQYRLEFVEPKFRELMNRRFSTIYANDVHLLSQNDIKWWLK